MTKYTHIVIDNLGSFPAIGDAVLEVSLSGQHQMKRVTAISLVSQRQPSMRWAYVALVDMTERADGQQSKMERIEDWHAFPQAIPLEPGDT
jgi:hypothetical protein